MYICIHRVPMLNHSSRGPNLMCVYTYMYTCILHIYFPPSIYNLYIYMYMVDTHAEPLHVELLRSIRGYQHI